MRATVEYTKYKKEFRKIITILNSEKYIPELSDYLYYLIDIKSNTKNYKAAYCIGCLFPFYITLPLYVLTKESISLPFFWWQKIKQIKVSSFYNLIITDPSKDLLMEYQSNLKYSYKVLDDHLSFKNKLDYLFEDKRIKNYSKEQIEDFKYAIRNNDIIRAIYYLLIYLGYSINTSQKVINYLNICLIQKCTL